MWRLWMLLILVAPVGAAWTCPPDPPWFEVDNEWPSGHRTTGNTTIREGLWVSTDCYPQGVAQPEPLHAWIDEVDPELVVRLNGTRFPFPTDCQTTGARIPEHRIGIGVPYHVDVRNGTVSGTYSFTLGVSSHCDDRNLTQRTVIEIWLLSQPAWEVSQMEPVPTSDPAFSAAWRFTVANTGNTGLLVTVEPEMNETTGVALRSVPPSKWIPAFGHAEFLIQAARSRRTDTPGEIMVLVHAQFDDGTQRAKSARTNWTLTPDPPRSTPMLEPASMIGIVLAVALWPQRAFRRR